MSMPSDDSEIVVVGMVGRFPGARNLEQFWRNLRDGKESIRFLSDQELTARGLDPALLTDPSHVRAVAELDHPDCFDAEFFGINHREAEILDPQQRVFLECAWQALESAGYYPEGYDGAIGLFAGATTSTYLLFNLVSHAGFGEHWDPLELLVANAGDSLATRVSYKLNLKGPSFTVQCACSTSLVAVHLACESLLNEECDMALAGGISINVRQRTGYRYQEGSIASPDGHCRPFDAGAQGTIFGSGVGVVVLKRRADAVADGDTIHAVIRSSAINNDGSLKVGYTAPSVEGQSEVIAEALGLADVPAESISYVEAHGTATNLGDPIEIQALTRAFRTYTEETGFCAIGAVKGNIGHLDIAAGIAGLIKTILALEHRRIPPSLHFDQPNPKIDFAASPVYVNRELREWPGDGTPRRAGVSSFGFGGTNAHLIVEEAPAPPESGRSRPWQLLVLSAKTREALDQATSELADHLRRHQELALADVAYTLGVGRKAFSHRRILVCRDRAEAAEWLASREPQRLLTRSDTLEPRQRPVVFMLSGQGAQYVNMGRELYELEASFRDTVDRCAQELEPLLGWDLRRVLYPTPGEEEEAQRRLEPTAVTQPALFVVEYALAKLWMEWGIEPQAMIGHSIGEYVAACLAGVFSRADALRLVAARGRLMQEMPAGAMLSIPLAEEEVRSLLGDELELAAVNAPAQSTVTGPTPAVEALAGRLAARGVDCRPLHTSHAFHSAMMDPILERFTDEVRGVNRRPPRIPYLSNLTGDWIRDEEATDPGYWARHLRHTVRFSAGVAELVREPERLLLEVGPGRTLATLARRHSGEGTALVSMRHPRDAETSDLAVLLTAVGRLWLAGRRIEWPRIFAGRSRRRLSLPTYPFERHSYWIEPGTPAAEVAPVTGKAPEMADWFYLPSWRLSLPPAPFREGDLADRRGRWLVFVDDGGLGAELVDRLRGEGQEVFTVAAGEEVPPEGDKWRVPPEGDKWRVPPEGDKWGVARQGEHDFTIDPRRAEDYERLLEGLDGTVNTIVHLWNVSRPRVGTPAERFDPAQERGYYSLLYLGRALGRREIAEDLLLLVAANGLHSVNGQEASCPEKATLLGPCMVLPQETPGIVCRVVDLVVPEAGCARPLEQLLAEIRRRGPDPVVAYRGPQRWVQDFEKVRLPGEGEARRQLRDRGVYLITGALGDVGLQLAEILAREVRARLVLLDPTALPERSQWDALLKTPGDGDGIAGTLRRLQALEEAGAELLVAAADVADEEAMRSAIGRAERRFGELHGVIYASGALADDRVYHPLSGLGRE
ncbi:MAG: acyltransferase domain-containing protein, partial [bacterium]|nr:acyltransferase domain-containing protein [bacterium]